MTKEAGRLKVKRGFSQAKDAAQAASEFIEQVEQPDTAVVVFFTSSNFDLKALEKGLKGKFSAPVLGCTTAGEITPVGYCQGTLTGFSIASDELEVFPFLIPSLQTFDGAKTKSKSTPISSYRSTAICSEKSGNTKKQVSTAGNSP